MSDSAPKASAIRVLLVDDHPTVRQTLRAALQAYPNIIVVGEAGDGHDAFVLVRQLQPAVVVIDINMPRMDGVTATRLIKVEYPQIAVIGLSLEQKEYQIFAMKKAGAFAVLGKEDSSVTELYAAIQSAVAAVQPVVIMEEPKNQAIDESKPSDPTESMAETSPVEGPQAHQEKKC